MERPDAPIDRIDIRPPVRRLLETLRRCHPRHTSERVEALRELEVGSLVEAERSVLRERLALVLAGNLVEESGAMTRRGCLATLPIAIVCGFLILQLVVSLAGFTPALFWALLWAVCSGFVWCFAGVLGTSLVQARSLRENDRVRAAAADVLAKIPDRSILPELATACADNSRQVRRSATGALMSLLASMSVADAAPLTKVETEALARTLPPLCRGDAVRAPVETGSPSRGHPQRAVDHCATVLGLLAERGATSIVGFLNRFARSLETPEEVREDARAAIARLEARRSEELQSEILLRPAAHDCNLVRPALPCPANDPVELLRATDGPGQ